MHSLTPDEVVRQAHEAFGNHINVECRPDSTQPYDYLSFGFSQLLTHEQLSIYFNKSADYNTEVAALRAKVIAKAIEIIDQVIVENESKVQ